MIWKKLSEGVSREKILQQVESSCKETSKDSIQIGIKKFTEIYNEFENLSIEKDENGMDLDEEKQYISYGSEESYESFEISEAEEVNSWINKLIETLDLFIYLVKF